MLDVRTRVVLIHNIVTPHVVPLYERLAAQRDIALQVYFLAATDKNRNWGSALSTRFSYRVLPHWAIRIEGADLFTYFINPTLPAVLLREPFDVVIVDGWDSFASLAAFVVARFRRKRYVMWAGSTVHEPSWRRTLAQPLVRALVRGADGCIAYGSRARDYLLQLGAHAERVVIAWNTVDVDWFAAQSDALRPQRASIRSDLGLDVPGRVVLYVGQLIERKGILDLLDAYEMLLAEHSDAQLLIVGTGPLERTVRERIDRRGLHRVRVAGHAPVSELPRFYAAADCFVLPSHEEVWGLVLNEAAACGLPLVTCTPVGAAPDLVEPGVNGTIVRAGCPTELAQALAAALRHAAEWGTASREIAQRFTFDQNVDAIRGLLASIAKREGAPA